MTTTTNRIELGGILYDLDGIVAGFITRHQGRVAIECNACDRAALLDADANAADHEALLRLVRHAIIDHEHPVGLSERRYSLALSIGATRQTHDAATPINPANYADDQQRILTALAVVDDLTQDAGDAGDSKLAKALHNAYHAIERFRILPGRAQITLTTVRECAGCEDPENAPHANTCPAKPMPSHIDGTCGCTDPYCQA